MTTLAFSLNELPSNFSKKTINMKKLNYNINDAIQLRGMTVNEAGYFFPDQMPSYVANQKIDFRTSLSMTSNKNNISFDPGNIPFHVEVLLSMGSRKSWEKISKEEWKKLFSSYRDYCRQARLESKEGMYSL